MDEYINWAATCWMLFICTLSIGGGCLAYTAAQTKRGWVRALCIALIAVALSLFAGAISVPHGRDRADPTHD